MSGASRALGLQPETERIERSHHHILFTRIPAYRREHLRAAQSIDKTVFEYWTHALSYVATSDLPPSFELIAIVWKIATGCATIRRCL